MMPRRPKIKEIKAHPEESRGIAGVNETRKGKKDVKGRR